VKQKIYATHLAGDDEIDAWSEEGRGKHLDVEVTKFILADFPLTDEEREQLATDEWALRNLAGIFLEGLDWAYSAELAVESWRGGDSIFLQTQAVE
jgi:hypothetical protein